MRNSAAILALLIITLLVAGAIQAKGPRERLLAQAASGQCTPINTRCTCGYAPDSNGRCAPGANRYLCECGTNGFCNASGGCQLRQCQDDSCKGKTGTTPDPVPPQVMASETADPEPGPEIARPPLDRGGLGGAFDEQGKQPAGPEVLDNNSWRTRPTPMEDQYPNVYTTNPDGTQTRLPPNAAWSKFFDTVTTKAPLDPGVTDLSGPDDPRIYYPPNTTGTIGPAPAPVSPAAPSSPWYTRAWNWLISRF